MDKEDKLLALMKDYVSDQFNYVKELAEEEDDHFKDTPVTREEIFAEAMEMLQADIDSFTRDLSVIGWVYDKKFYSKGNLI